MPAMLLSWAPGSQHPGTRGFQSWWNPPQTCRHWKIQFHQLYCPMGVLNFLLSFRSQLLNAQVNPRLHALVFCWQQGASLPTDHRALTTKPSCERAPAAPSKSGNPVPPLSGNLPHWGCQETFFPKAQKGADFPPLPDHGRAPASLLKRENTRFPTEGRKAITCYGWAAPDGLHPQGARRPSTPHCASLQENLMSAL
jgi:hypothetical protein